MEGPRDRRDRILLRHRVFETYSQLDGLDDEGGIFRNPRELGVHPADRLRDDRLAQAAGARPALDVELTYDQTQLPSLTQVMIACGRARVKTVVLARKRSALAGSPNRTGYRFAARCRAMSSMTAGSEPTPAWS